MYMIHNKILRFIEVIYSYEHSDRQTDSFVYSFVTEGSTYTLNIGGEGSNKLDPTTFT